VRISGRILENEGLRYQGTLRDRGGGGGGKKRYEESRKGKGSLIYGTVAVLSLTSGALGLQSGQHELQRSVLQQKSRQRVSAFLSQVLSLFSILSLLLQPSWGSVVPL
jgi:hypothetical protein